MNRTALPYRYIAYTLVLVVGINFCIKLKSRTRPLPSNRQPPSSSLAELLEMPPENLAQFSIARMSLLCAQNLGPGTKESGLDLDLCTLKAWAKHIQSETDRHWYRFQQKPAEFENSEGFFRMLMLAVVLQEDFRIRYDPERKGDPEKVTEMDGFFRDPKMVFISGLLGPERKGTCSSLPVLYVAIGRELGYPLKLVTTKAHLFVRWEGPGERFNVEATTAGLSRFDDEYYRHWPFEVSPEEEKANGYLKSLSPSEELAVFLSIRGMCLKELGRMSEAHENFSAASRLAPNCRMYRALAGNTSRQENMFSLK